MKPEFRLDLGDRRLWRGQDAIPITNKAFQLLKLFVESPERLVSKDEIFEQLWGDIYVSEGLVREYVHDLRVALEDDPKSPRFIETVPKQGYRFLGGIELEAGSNERQRPTLVVRSFEDLSRNERGARLARGLTDDLLTELVRMPDIAVLVREDSTSAASYVLDGSVQVEGSKIRVNVRLRGDSINGHVWAEKYERSEGELMDVQSDIASRIAIALGAATGPVARAELDRLRRPEKTSLKAWEMTRLAYDLEIEFRKDNAFRALDLVQSALRMEPGYAQAWLVQGWIYWQIAMEGWCDNPDEFRKRTIESYLRAAALDPTHAVAQMEAAAARAVAGDMPGAAASLERALDLGESQPDIQISCANYVASILDDPERAVSIMDRSFELVYRKSSFHYLTELRVCVFSGDYERAFEAAPFAPELIQTRLFRALAMAGLGKDVGQAANDVFARVPKFSAHAYLNDHPIKGMKVTSEFLQLVKKAGLNGT